VEGPVENRADVDISGAISSSQCYRYRDWGIVSHVAAVGVVGYASNEAQ
jgi:hypothetical protein